MPFIMLDLKIFKVALRLVKHCSFGGVQMGLRRLDRHDLLANLFFS